MWTAADTRYVVAESVKCVAPLEAALCAAADDARLSVDCQLRLRHVGRLRALMMRTTAYTVHIITRGVRCPGFIRALAATTNIW